VNRRAQLQVESATFRFVSGAKEFLVCKNTIYVKQRRHSRI